MEKPAGMKAFFVIWIGQCISYIGTGMTRFAMTVWAYQTTGSAEALALVGFFSFVPIMLMTPFAGALTDRWDRKTVIILSDAGAALATGFIAVLYFAGDLQVWHLMVAGAIGGLFEAFQWPALSASVTNMVDKQNYTRANGLLSMADSTSRIIAPLLASVLIVTLGLGGILIIDILTCFVAVVGLLLVQIAKPTGMASTPATFGNLLRDAAFGFVYIWRRGSLLALALVFFFINFFGDLSWILLAPLLLTRTGDATALAIVQSAVGIGGVVGGLVLGAWGGSKRRIDAVLIGFMVSGIFGTALMGLGRSLPVWIIAGFVIMFVMPIAGGSSQAIWQSKVEPVLQGRVFAARRVTAQISVPFGVVLGGVLADRIFEPMMQNVDSLGAQLFGPLVGTGPGAGMALLFVLAGLATALVGVIGYFIPILRDVEKILPDGGVAKVAPSAILEPELGATEIAAA
jgi:MFS family permease